MNIHIDNHRILDLGDDMVLEEKNFQPNLVVHAHIEVKFAYDGTGHSERSIQPKQATDNTANEEDTPTSTFKTHR